MGEHDDDLEVTTAQEAPSSVDATRVAEAIAQGLQRIATALETGLRELAQVIAAANGLAGREKPGERRHHPR